MWFSELNKWMGWQGWLWDRHTLWASYPTEGTSLCHVVWCSVILAKWGQWNNFHWWPWAETEREAPEVKHHLSQQPFPEQPGQNSLCGGRQILGEARACLSRVVCGSRDARGTRLVQGWQGAAAAWAGAASDPRLWAAHRDEEGNNRWRQADGGAPGNTENISQHHRQRPQHSRGPTVVKSFVGDPKMEGFKDNAGGK